MDFKIGVTMEMLLSFPSTLKRVLCERCRSVSQREPGLRLEEFAEDASSVWCHVDILVEVQSLNRHVYTKHHHLWTYEVTFLLVD